MATLDIDRLDLAALLCSRVCHDVISPVGAIVNGLEVLEEEKDQETRDFALDLIRKSARQASARLQFARLAFGAAGSAGAMIDTGDAESVARGFIHDDKVKLSWTGPRLLMAKNRVKLMLNLLLIAQGCIPRGGQIGLVLAGDADNPDIVIEAEGVNARVPHGIEASLAGMPESGHVDAHVIQPFYAGLIARAAGMAVTIALDGGKAVIRAKPATA
jgi:histidine phosphotransferase ChpT